MDSHTSGSRNPPNATIIDACVCDQDASLDGYLGIVFRLTATIDETHTRPIAVIGWLRSLGSECVEIKRDETPRKLKEAFEECARKRNGHRLHESLDRETPAAWCYSGMAAKQAARDTAIFTFKADSVPNRISHFKLSGWQAKLSFA